VRHDLLGGFDLDAFDVGLLVNSLLSLRSRLEMIHAHDMKLRGVQASGSLAAKCRLVAYMAPSADMLKNNYAYLLIALLSSRLHLLCLVHSTTPLPRPLGPPLLWNLWGTGLLLVASSRRIKHT
jgi:hypothetical protein